MATKPDSGEGSKRPSPKARPADPSDRAVSQGGSSESGETPVIGVTKPDLKRSSKATQYVAHMAEANYSLSKEIADAMKALPDGVRRIGSAAQETHQVLHEIDKSVGSDMSGKVRRLSWMTVALFAVTAFGFMYLSWRIGLISDCSKLVETAVHTLHGKADDIQNAISTMNGSAEAVKKAAEDAAQAVESQRTESKQIKSKLEDIDGRLIVMEMEIESQRDNLSTVKTGVQKAHEEMKKDMEDSEKRLMQAFSKIKMSSLPPPPPNDYYEEDQMPVTGEFHEVILSKDKWSPAYSKRELSIPGSVRIDRHPGILAVVYYGWWPMKRSETPILVEPGKEFNINVRGEDYRYVRFCLAPDAEETKPDGSPVVIRSIKKKK